MGLRVSRQSWFNCIGVGQYRDAVHCRVDQSLTVYFVIFFYEAWHGFCNVDCCPSDEPLYWSHLHIFGSRSFGDGGDNFFVDIHFPGFQVAWSWVSFECFLSVTDSLACLLVHTLLTRSANSWATFSPCSSAYFMRWPASKADNWPICCDVSGPELVWGRGWLIPDLHSRRHHHQRFHLLQPQAKTIGMKGIGANPWPQNGMASCCIGPSAESGLWYSGAELSWALALGVACSCSGQRDTVAVVFFRNFESTTECFSLPVAFP